MEKRQKLAVNKQPGLLRVLIEFLNAKIDNLDHRHLSPTNVLRWILSREVAPSGQLRRKSLKKLQETLREDILSVVEPKPVSQGAWVPWTDISDKGFWLHRLVSKIDEMRMCPGRSLVPWREIKRERFPLAVPLKLGNEQVAVIESRLTRSAKEDFYWILDISLRYGAFSRLRKCPYCENFFFADHASREFCSRKGANNCQTKFFNEKKVRSGKAAKYQDQWRKKKLKKQKEEQRKKQRSLKGKKRERLEAIMKNLIDASRKAASKPPPEPIKRKIKRLGNGNFLDGWKIIDSWRNQHTALLSLTKTQQNILLGSPD